MQKLLGDAMKNKSNIFKLIVALIGIGILVLMIILYSKSNMNSTGGADRAEVLDKESQKKDKGEQVFLIPKDDVHEFTLTDANGLLLNFENTDGEWICIDNTSLDINEERIDKVLNYLCDVRCIGILTDVDAKSYGIDESAKEYRVTDSSGSTIIISIGNYDEDKKQAYFSINYDFSTIYINSGKLSLVEEYAIEDLIQL